MRVRAVSFFSFTAGAVAGGSPRSLLLLQPLCLRERRKSQLWKKGISGEESGWADSSGEAEAGTREKSIPTAKREAGTASEREGTAEVPEQAEGCALPVCACLLLFLKVIEKFWGMFSSLISLPSFSLSEEKSQAEEMGRGRGQ